MFDFTCQEGMVTQMSYEEALCILQKDFDDPELKELDPDFWNQVFEAKRVIKRTH